VPAGPARRISKGRDVPAVALSFDAGSDTGYTADILDLLAREHIHASFGVTGKWAKSNPELFRRIVAEGHHVINHTYDHSSMTGRSTKKPALDRAARAKQLQQADAIFVELTGRSAKPWFRPPYGDIDTALDAVLGEEGYAYDTLWSLDSLGWKGLSAPDITARCEKAIAPGAIFLFHVGAQSQDAAALPAIVAAIRKAGLTPGSLLDVV
jgi:peptidoglycan/xylan/chitin deacetylase (PgdA/CDA1 family)